MRGISNPILRTDRKRKALCAVAAKVARVAHGVNQDGTDYRPYFEALLPVEYPFARAVEAGTDLVDNARSFHWGCLLCGVR